MTQLRYTLEQLQLHAKTPIRLSHINYYVCDKREADIFPGHPYAKLIFVLRGSGHLVYGSYKTFIQTNNLILINPEKEKFYFKMDTNPTELIILGIENVYFQSGKDTYEFPLALFDCSDGIYPFFVKSILEELKQKNPLFESVCNHYLELLLITLSRDNGIGYHSLQEEKYNQDCENIKEFLDTHFSEEITLDMLSKKSGMNKYYLVHSFTKKYVRSPISYLNEKRIDESKKLLENSDFPIAEIAKRIGFSSQSYFSQAFKKKTLMTPNEFRRSIRKKI